MWKNCVGVVVVGSITVACSGAGHSGFGNRNTGTPADSGPIDTGSAPSLDGGGGTLPPSGPTFGSTCTGAATTLTGTVYAPNGTDPLPNIYVYIAGTVNPFPSGNYCNQCSKPLDVWYTETQSAADGTFSLDLSMVPYGASATFVVNVGSFRKVTTVPVSCGANTAPALASTLPGKSADGDIPKIAVTTGNSDHLDQILNVLGITEYDCYEGRASTSSTPTCTPIDTAAHLLEKTSAKTIDDYNLLFVSCAPDAYKTFGSPAIAANTNAFVTAGGRLFATDMSYDYVAQAFPSDITWMGPTGAPQPVDGANVGVGGSYTGNIDDPSLVTWLNKLGADVGGDGATPGVLEPVVGPSLDFLELEPHRRWHRVLLRGKRRRTPHDAVRRLELRQGHLQLVPHGRWHGDGGQLASAGADPRILDVRGRHVRLGPDQVIDALRRARIAASSSVVVIQVAARPCR